MAKVCIKCGTPKDAQKDFYRRSDSDKAQNTCKGCRIAYAVKLKQDKRNGITPEPTNEPVEPGKLRCNNCGDEKTKDHFHKRNDRPGQYYKPCKQCKRDHEANKRLHSTNKRKRLFTDKDFETFGFA